MKKNYLIIIVPLSVLALAITLISFDFQTEKTVTQAKTQNIDYADDDPFMGDKNAPVTMVEFSDYECPYCYSFYSKTLPKIIEKYIDTGKVKFVYRDFPLTFHRNAKHAAIAAECARDQKGDKVYFKYHNLIFDNQKSLNFDFLKNIAEALDLNISKFNDCLDNEKYKDEVYKDYADGSDAGVKGTPGFLINGQLVSGAKPFAVFEKIIEELLNK